MLSSMTVQAMDSENGGVTSGSRALGYFTMPELQVEPGETVVVPISFTCEDPVRALGVYTTVPDGFEVISVEPTDRAIAQFQYATPAGQCNMAFYDIYNQLALAGTEGVVVNITLKAAENLSGDYTYTINRSDYGIVGTSDSYYPENVSTTIHVGGTPSIGALGVFSMPSLQVEAGDTFVLPVSFNCENSVYSLAFGVAIPTGFEVVSVQKADRVTGTFQYATPAGAVNVAIYDINGASAINGNEGPVINITLKATENLSGDYTFTVNDGNYGAVGFVGNPQYPESVSTTIHVNNTPTPGALGVFTMPELQVEAGDTFVLPVSFNCENSVYSLAFGVAIPEGFEVVSVEKADRVTGTFQYATPAGAVNVAIYDLNGASAINGNEGPVINITLKATENLSGDYTFTVSEGNYGIVGLVGNPQYPQDASTTVHVNATPSIGALGVFTMPELQVEAGDTFVLPVSFNCENSVYSLAFAVDIPEGFEIVSVQKADRVTGTYGSGTPEGTNTVNVIIYNLDAESAIDGHDGPVVNITLKATENLSGDYTVILRDGNYGAVGFVGNPQYPENVSTTIHVNAATPTPGALGYFTMPELQVEPGQTVVVPISFTCEDPVRALGVFTTVPEGFEVISVEPTERAIAQFQYATPAGQCNMAFYDIYNQRVLAGTDGVIVNITLKAAENLSGDYTYTINRSDYGIVGNLEEVLYPESVSTTIHIVSPQGDVNGDNQVNVSDVTLLVNYLVNEDSPEDMPASADVNRDSTVNVSDVTTLVNILLNRR